MKESKPIVKTFSFLGEKDRLITITVQFQKSCIFLLGEMWAGSIGWSICRPGDNSSPEIGTVIAQGRAKKMQENYVANMFLAERPSVALMEAIAIDYNLRMTNHPEEFYVHSKKSKREELEIKHKEREKQLEDMRSKENAAGNEKLIKKFRGAIVIPDKKKEDKPKRKYVRKNKEYWDKVDKGEIIHGRGRKSNIEKPAVAEPA